MKYKLINNLGEEKEYSNLNELKNFLLKPYSYWKIGTGESGIQIKEDERIIFFKIKEGIFIMYHPDYLVPICKDKNIIDSISHYISGEEMKIPDVAVCNEELAYEILSDYIKNGKITDIVQ